MGAIIKYIRLGTLGIKTRYLLANAYISLGRYSEAKVYLEEIDSTMKEIQKEQKKSKESKESEGSETSKKINRGHRSGFTCFG